MKRFTGLDESALQALAKSLAPQLRPGDTLTLEGPLGAGKSSFARALLQGLGLDPAIDVPSPTFSLIIGYGPPDLPLAVWHGDLYRLDHASDVQALDLHGLAEDALLIVEWPERWRALLPPDALAIRIEVDGCCRNVDVADHGNWQTRLKAWQP